MQSFFILSRALSLVLLFSSQVINAFVSRGNVSQGHLISRQKAHRYASRFTPKSSQLNSSENIKDYTISTDDSTTPVQKPLQKQRKISHVEKFARLPVWPAWNGALLFILSKVLPNTIIAKLEDQFGGRVCPNFFQDTMRTSPFIMLVHHVHSFTAFDPLRLFQKKVILPEGFPSHPHRGFITLTYCLHGGMKHRDSIGFKQSYGNEKRHDGKIAQWLVTGAGMLHEGKNII